MMSHPGAQAFLGSPGAVGGGGVYALTGETGRQGSVALEHVCEHFSVFPEFMFGRAAERAAFPHASPHISSSRSIPLGKFPRGCRGGIVPSGKDGCHVRTCCNSFLLGNLNMKVLNTLL